MTHPEIIEYRGDRRLKCATRGCDQVLSVLPLVTISGDGQIRFVWRCGRCRKATELVADISDSCWTSNGSLIPSTPDG